MQKKLEFKMQKKLEEAGCLHATSNPAIRGLRLRMSAYAFR